MHLLPWDALMVLALHYDNPKYPNRNWEKGLKWDSGCAASLARHLAAWSQGEDVDSEGLYHDTAMAWNALSLLAFRLRQIGEDDRPLYIDSPSKQRSVLVEPPLEPLLPPNLTSQEKKRLREIGLKIDQPRKDHDH